MTYNEAESRATEHKHLVGEPFGSYKIWGIRVVPRNFTRIKSVLRNIHEKKEPCLNLSLMGYQDFDVILMLERTSEDAAPVEFMLLNIYLKASAQK